MTIMEIPQITRGLDYGWFKSNILTVITLIGDKDGKKVLRLDSLNPTQLKRVQKITPIFFELWVCDKYLKENRGKVFNPTSEFFKLAQLGEDLSILSKSDTEGLQDRIRELVTEKYEKVVYEIKIASLMTQWGHKVKFVKTAKNRKSPDICINYDTGIAVECKKKDPETARDKNNKEIWNTIERKLFKMMQSSRINCIGLIKTSADPTPDTIPKIISFFNSFLKKSDEQMFHHSDETFDLYFFKTTAWDEEIKGEIIFPFRFIPQGLSIPWINEADFVDFQFAFQELDSGTRTSDVQGFLFKSDNQPDRIKSIFNSVKSAIPQLSETRPNIICIEVTFTQSMQNDLEFKRLFKGFDEIVRCNSKISCILLTADFFGNDNTGKLIHYQSEMPIHNNKAQNPLHKNFKLSFLK